MKHRSELRKILLATSILGFAFLMQVNCQPTSGDNSKRVEKEQEDQVVAGGKESGDGCTLFARNNCSDCHSIDGVGGWMAPPLDGISERRSKQFILARISHSRQELEEFNKLKGSYLELLKHPRLSQSNASLVAAYLMTLPAPRGGFRVVRHIQLPPQDVQAVSRKVKPLAAEGSSVERGRTLYADHGCAACHGIGELGGRLAPRLDGISTRHNVGEIVDKISSAEMITKSAEGKEIERVMPPNGLNASETKEIAEFLLSLPDLSH